jgi:hypothetical protein
VPERKERCAYFVQLVEVAQDDGIVGDLRKDLLSHGPSSLLFFFPVELWTLRVGGALSVVTAEERISAVDDVLSVDPVILCTSTIVIHDRVPHIDIAPPAAESVWRDRGIVGQEVIAPFCA